MYFFTLAFIIFLSVSVVSLLIECHDNKFKKED